MDLRGKKTCKDCLHYEPCFEYGNILNPIHGGVTCDSFKSAADMVEVKHGELIETTEWIGSMAFDCIKCSACEDKWIMDEDYDLDFYKEQWAYCPFCGAKLNGGKNNGNL